MQKLFFFPSLAFPMVKIKDGSSVYIVFDKRRMWLRKVIAGSQFHSDRGFLNFDDMIGKNYGETFLLQPNNHKVALLQPLPSDIIFQMKRQSQIIYPDDIGLILTYGGVHHGSRIIEAGTGSGTVSSILGIFAQPDGHVHTFDIRDIAMRQAKKNIKGLGADQWVTASLGNILEDDYSLEKMDFIMLDLATTWEAVPKVSKYLADSGRICLFSPTIEQVKKNVRSLEAHNYHGISSFELITRTFQVKPNATRPNSRMIGHTGYLTFARKTEGELLPIHYSGIYSPENIGNLFIYGGIYPNARILVLSQNSQQLKNLFNFFFNMEDILFLDTDAEDNPIERLFEPITEFLGIPKDEIELNESNLFDVIVMDNLYLPDLAQLGHKYLNAGGTFCTITDNLEIIKDIYDFMFRGRYFKLRASESIKRNIEVDENNCSRSRLSSDYTGYLAFGRKVNDIHGDMRRIPKEKEFLDEPLLGIGVNFKESLPEEEPKIDYANIREEDDK